MIRNYADMLRDLKKLDASSTKHSTITIPKALSRGEETLAAHLNAVGIKYEREYEFHPTRKWRFDFAFPAIKLAVEIEGGGNNGLPGRHQTYTGFENDAIKYNAAAKHGWRVLRYTTRLVINGVALADIEEVMGKGRIV